MKYFTLNLRGTIFVVEEDFIHDYELKTNSPLAQLNESSKYYNKDRDEFYFNRSSSMFDAVLDYLATGSLHIPGNICAERFQKELEFWGIPTYKLEKCCWRSFYGSAEDVATLDKLLCHIPCESLRTNGTIQLPERSESGCSKSNVYRILTDNTTNSGKVWYGIMCVTILLSTFLFVVMTVPAFRVPVDTTKSYPYSVTSNTALMYYITRPHYAVVAIDTACNVIFMVDWLVRFFCAPSKLAFIRSFLTCVELISWVFQWIGLWMELQRELFAVEGIYPVLFIITLIYCLRVLRIFRLLNNNVGFKILLLSLKSSARELFLLTVGFSCVAVVFALLLYMAEMGTDTDVTLPNVFVSIWWAVVTMTTVGYGDYYPTTAQGYCIGCLCALTGILLIALPMAVTSSNFSDYYTFNKYRERYMKTVEKTENSD
ncbi:potassium voltage-gated channel subfamily C member 3-like [Ylistrum balloti]|uniref:potassium voltage-gated channel subfamily C member 3-like n=1 Tax=Ylistrum balloti TaxID=509963 RepID=UPI002905A9E5|nr:potassium voltage-gated channel subfamily C member 3-like [Ylistrum balloti]XP_060084469.1 potassium voltage-gated channel subfamily C member 3-like [Ylistrum balloti]